VDINQILFLVALLNLLGDLYNLHRFRHEIPKWLPKANIVALCATLAAKLFAPDQIYGFITLGILLVYIATIKLGARPRSRPPQLSTPATKLLIATTLVAYGYQVYANAIDDPYELVRAGALFTPLLADGQWWRLITAQFIHWGLPHLAMNMLGLWFLGPAVELALGSIRFIIAYLICGAGGMGLAWAVAEFAANSRPIIVMGASASVLGLVGIQAAFSLISFRRSGSLVAKAQLSSMTQILVLQAVFDWMVPQVSSTAHLGGAAVGFILGTLILRARIRRRLQPPIG
jgi:rhomboid protease GluP